MTSLGDNMLVVHRPLSLALRRRVQLVALFNNEIRHLKPEASRDGPIGVDTARLLFASYDRRLRQHRRKLAEKFEAPRAEEYEKHPSARKIRFVLHRSDAKEHSPEDFMVQNQLMQELQRLANSHHPVISKISEPTTFRLYLLDDLEDDYLGRWMAVWQSTTGPDAQSWLLHSKLKDERSEALKDLLAQIRTVHPPNGQSAFRHIKQAKGKKRSVETDGEVEIH